MAGCRLKVPEEANKPSRPEVLPVCCVPLLLPVQRWRTVVKINKKFQNIENILKTSVINTRWSPFLRKCMTRPPSTKPFRLQARVSKGMRLETKRKRTKTKRWWTHNLRGRSTRGQRPSRGRCCRSQSRHHRLKELICEVNLLKHMSKLKAEKSTMLRTLFHTGAKSMDVKKPQHHNLKQPKISNKKLMGMPLCMTHFKSPRSINTKHKIT